MKVYVSELPKDCIECPFCQDIKVNAGMDRLLFCKANKGRAIKNIEKSFDKCIVKNEFKSLTDYTKQVREEVVEEIRKQLKDMDFLANDTELGERFSCYSKYKVLDILLKVERNQVKGENNARI